MPEDSIASLPGGKATHTCPMSSRQAAAKHTRQSNTTFESKRGLLDLFQEATYLATPWSSGNTPQKQTHSKYGEP